VLKYPNCPYEDYWTEVSKNPSISLEDIDRYPNLPWDWHIMCETRPITLEFVAKHINKNWDWNRLVKRFKFKSPPFDLLYNYTDDDDEYYDSARYYIEYYRTSVRSKCIKEELVAKVFNPKNVERWLEIGDWSLVDMMFGK